MYASLLKGILMRYCTADIGLVFEQEQRLYSLYNPLVQHVLDLAMSSPKPRVEVYVGGKSAPALAVVDHL
jgi:hypothetical protein